MATNTSKKSKSQKRQAIIRIVVMAAILVCINMIAAFYHYGFDLTKDKRFTLSVPTKKLLRNMDDVAVINVYLKGKFPAGFQRLADATRERLQSFRDIAGTKVIVRFIDPFAGKTEDEKGPIFKELAAKGVNGMNLQVQNEEEGYSERIIFPYALVQYKGREMPVRLLENVQGFNPLQNLSNSEVLLEYKFANAISNLSQPEKIQIAYIIGHGETLGFNTYDLLATLSEHYIVDTFDLSANIYIPNYYKTIIVNRPTKPIDDREKFKIDQYVMNGGKILWAIDQLYTPMDSLRNSGAFMTLDYGLELDDLLFKWGVRINTDIIEDLQQCLLIPVTVGMQGNGQPQIQNLPWIYYPYFTPVSSHPIVKNLGAIMGRFVNSIDTVENPGIKKTVLLQSSQYSRTEQFPFRVSLGMFKYPLTPEMFKKPYRTAAVLLEGRFKSIFENRLAPNFLQILRDSLKREYKTVADTATSMIVIADGEVMENDFSKDGPMEMGYWKYTDTRFSNKEFILNCIEYLTDNSGVLEARAKDQVIRKLDSKRVTQEKTKWRLVNIGIPIVLVLVFASAFIFFRKRRYERNDDRINKVKENG